jgi:hypothetical protein
VVFVPSSTRVTVPPPSFVTLTAGACAGAVGAADVAAGAGVDEAVVGAGVDGAGAVVAAAGAGVGAAAGADDAAAVGDAAAVAAGALVVVVRAGGGVGSAAAVPAGFAAAVPPAAPERLCRSCGRSFSASVRWLRAASGLPAVMSVIPPSMSPTAFMLLGRMLLATSPTSFPGSVTTALMSETMLPRLRPMTFSLWLLVRPRRAGWGWISPG